MIYDKLSQTLLKRSKLELLCFIFIIVLSITTFVTYIKKNDDKIEGLSSSISNVFKKKFEYLKNNDIYDEFYVSIYDKLFFDKKKLNLELSEIVEKTRINKSSSILDIGSGTGHHLNVLHNIAGEVKGVDKSLAMVQYSTNKYPFLNVKHDDANNSMIFTHERFTHITMFYFTVYCFENKRQILQNCYKWLKPGGYLIIHMVNRDKFDPILAPSNPLHLVSPQKYAEQRITKSAIKFNSFSYKSNFEHHPEKDVALFKEILKNDKTNNIRGHELKLYIEKQKKILDLAKLIGFAVKGKISLTPCQYEYQYIYILTK